MKPDVQQELRLLVREYARKALTHKDCQRQERSPVYLETGSCQRDRFTLFDLRKPFGEPLAVAQQRLPTGRPGVGLEVLPFPQRLHHHH